MTKAKRGASYSDAENRAIAAAYVRMAVAQFNGEKVNKSAIIRGLIEISNRSRGSIEAKFMNYSGAAVAGDFLPELPGGYVKGYKPAANGQKSIKDHLIVAIYRNKAAWAIAGQLGSVVDAGALG